MIFVGREVELEELEKEWVRNGSFFTVIHGRMRVGKTQLIKKFLSGKDGIYYPASEEADVIQ